MPSNQIIISCFMLSYLAFAYDESVDTVGRTPLQVVKCGLKFLLWFCGFLSLERIQNENTQFLFINAKA